MIEIIMQNHTTFFILSQAKFQVQYSLAYTFKLCALFCGDYNLSLLQEG